MFTNDLEFENHEHDSLLYPLDYFSKSTLLYEQLSSKTQFLFDKLTLKLNLAICYSKIPSYLDYEANEGQGFITGSNYYLKSAGTY